MQIFAKDRLALIFGILFPFLFVVLFSFILSDVGSEDERLELEGLVDKVYLSFLKDVAENRNLSLDYVRNISQGRIYLGSEAKDVGLVDELGGFDEAIEAAARLGGIEGEPGILKPERKVSWMDLLE